MGGSVGRWTCKLPGAYPKAEWWQRVPAIPVLAVALPTSHSCEHSELWTRWDPISEIPEADRWPPSMLTQVRVLTTHMTLTQPTPCSFYHVLVFIVCQNIMISQKQFQRKFLSSVFWRIYIELELLFINIFIEIQHLHCQTWHFLHRKHHLENRFPFHILVN